MRSVRRLFFIVLICSTVGLACSKKPPLGPELIAFGDSITDGTLNYGPESFGYRKYLQDELGIWTYIYKGQFESGKGHKYQKAHSGVIGETNSQIKARLDA